VVSGNLSYSEFRGWTRGAQIWQVAYLIVLRPSNEILPLIKKNGLLTLPIRTSMFLKFLPLEATGQG